MKKKKNSKYRPRVNGDYERLQSLKLSIPPPHPQTRPAIQKCRGIGARSRRRRDAEPTALGRKRRGSNRARPVKVAAGTGRVYRRRERRFLRDRVRLFTRSTRIIIGFFFLFFGHATDFHDGGARGFRRADGRSSSSRTRWCPDGNPIKRNNNISCRNAVCNVRHGFRRGVSKTTRKTAESGDVRIARSARERLGKKYAK